MSEDAFNMSMRKFLKQVGVTSQHAIEEHVRKAGGGGTMKVKVVLTDSGGGLRHEVDGEITLP